MDPQDPYSGASGPAPQVWPPPPTNAPTVADDSPLAATAAFRTQNYWLVLLLTIITLGVYEVFWLKRQAAVIHRLRPDLKVTQVYANVVLVGVVLNIGLAVASGISDSGTLDTDSNILSRLVGIMLLVLLFQVRNALNMLLRVQGGSPYWFSGVFTWLFGAAYLQYKINQNARRRQTEPPRTEPSRRLFSPLD